MSLGKRINGAQAVTQTDSNGDPLSTTNGAVHVAPNGSVTAVSGTSKTWIVTGLDGNPTTADDFITDATGWKGASISVPGELATGQHMLIGWSTDVDDESTISGILSSLDGDLDTPPATATARQNTAVLSFNGLSEITILWDGSTKIKTICVRGHGAANVTAIHTVG